MDSLVFLILAFLILGLLTYGITKAVIYIGEKYFHYKLSFAIIFTGTFVAIIIVNVVVYINPRARYMAPDQSDLEIGDYNVDTSYHLSADSVYYQPRVEFKDYNVDTSYEYPQPPPPTKSISDSIEDILVNFGDSGTDLIRNSLEELVNGKLAYHIPDTMQIHRNYKGVVTISKALNDSILFQDLDSSYFQKESIKVTSRVKVNLKDPTDGINFQITELGTEEQLVDDSTNTIWQWNIIPLRRGENELILVATVKFGEHDRDIPVFEKRIKVQASFVASSKQFIGNNWQFLLSAIIIPLLIWVYTKISTRKKSNNRPPTIIGFRRKKAKK